MLYCAINTKISINNAQRESSKIRTAISICHHNVSNYNGTKPNDFERSEQIVIIGKMKGEEFAASGILMKCPSKYANPEEQRKELNQGAQAQK